MTAGQPTHYTEELAEKICKLIANGMSLKRKNLIYSLSDKEGTKYIGQTTVPKKRFSQHFSIAQNRGNAKVNKWLYKMLSKRETPTIKILEFTDKLNDREKYWIGYYRDKGIELLNMTSGGFDGSFLRRKKLEKPWGKTLSPVQYR